MPALELTRGGALEVLAALDGRTTDVIVRERLAPPEFGALDELLQHRPGLWVSAISSEGFPHLGFLEELPSVRRLRVACPILSDLNGVAAAPELRRLVLERTQWPKISLAPLESAGNLDHLGVHGWSAGLDVLGQLPELTHLDVGGVRQPDGAFLSGVPGLRHLEWDPGATGDASHLEVLSELSSLRLRKASKLEQIDGVGGLQSLRYLGLTRLSNLRRLPDMNRMTGLGVVRIDTCGVLRDLTQLQNAASLEHISIHLNHLTAADLTFLRSHPGQPSLTIRLATRAHTSEVRETLGLQVLGEGEVPDLPMELRAPDRCWPMATPFGRDCLEDRDGFS